MRIFRVLLFIFYLCLTEAQNTECLTIKLRSIINNSKICVFATGVFAFLKIIQPGDDLLFDRQEFSFERIKIWDTKNIFSPCVTYYLDDFDEPTCIYFDYSTMAINGEMGFRCLLLEFEKLNLSTTEYATATLVCDLILQGHVGESSTIKYSLIKEV